VTICYLDPEDEITGAVARIRSVEDGEAVLVLPPGSRIATSRINFRLLAREAKAKGLTMVAVSDEPGVRALAISAGLPAYDSVMAAQGGLKEFARQERQLAARIGDQAPEPPGSEADQRDARGSTGRSSSQERSVPDVRRPVEDRLLAAAATPGTPRGPTKRAALPPDSTRVMAVPAAPGRDGEGRNDDDRDEAYSGRRKRRRRSPLAPLLAVGLLLALVGVAVYGLYTFLPTATITVRPHLASVGPVTGVVVADPRVAVVDSGEGVIPAQLIQLPLSASDEFPASGARVTTIRAAGTVRFRSENTVTEVAIPAGTRVATGNDIAFDTTAEVVVPRAVFGTGTPGRVDAPVRAVRAGPRGNVTAGSITVVSPSLAEQLVFVTNPQPTSGGDRRTTTIVTAEDYGAAVDQLRGQLVQRLEQAIADPANTPRGLTVYLATAQLGRISADPPESTLVDSPAESFSLTVSTPASVLATNEALVELVMVEQLRVLVPPGSTLVEQSIESSHTPGEVSGGTIIFSASANGRAYRLPAREVLVEEVRGLPLTEARAIIERYGNAELSVWPEFIDRVPDQPVRINLTILPPTEST
jgi:hypothetical protein